MKFITLIGCKESITFNLAEMTGITIVSKDSTLVKGIVIAFKNAPNFSMDETFEVSEINEAIAEVQDFNPYKVYSNERKAL